MAATGPGSKLRAPVTVYTDTHGTTVQVIDKTGALTGSIAPTSFTADTLFTAANKLQFRATGIYISSPGVGQLQIVTTAAGAADLAITGSVTISGATALASTLSVASTTALADDTTLATSKKIIFRSSATFINSPTSGKLAITATAAGADDITITGSVTLTGALAISSTLGVTGAATLSSTLAVTGATTLTGAATLSSTLAVTGVSTLTGALAVTAKITSAAGIQARAVAVTATTGGGTTGIIPDDCSVVTPTSSVNTKAVTLPTPTPGVVVWINAETSATGYKLQSSTPASVAINGGTGASATSAVAAAKVLRCYCASATTWIVTVFAADGSVSALTPAA